jgi:hypothetical protein
MIAKNADAKKPAGTGGSLPEFARASEQTEFQARVHQFCDTDGQDASVSARRSVVGGIQRAITDRRPPGMPKPMVVEDRALDYDDLQFVRDLVDLFGAGRWTNDKRLRGRLAGLAVCLYEDRIEVYGPLANDAGIEVVGWFDDPETLPRYGWRCSATNTLFRADIALIAHLAAEARLLGGAA